MEFPNIGKHCSEPSCNKLDFLPVNCDACSNIFCHEHMTYTSHKCPEAYSRNVQVPVCPLCYQPIPTKRHESPDVYVSAHIDRDCQSDKAKEKRKVYSKRCSLKGCRRKELIPFICPTCQHNYCISHRHSADHHCNENETKIMSKPKDFRGYIQGTMDEDEAYAHAIALSLRESEQIKTTRTMSLPQTLLSTERNPNLHFCTIS